MTQPADFSRTSAHHRMIRHIGQTCALFLVVIMLWGLGTVPASAAPNIVLRSTVADPLPVFASTQGSLDVSITNISHPVATPGDKVTIQAKITNTTDTTVTGAVAQLTIDYVALTSRTAITEWSTAGLLAPVYGEPIQDTPTQKPLPRLASGASKTVSFRYDPGGQALQGFGARRLAISVGDTTGRLGVARSFLIYDAEDTKRKPMQLSVLAAVTSPATDPADPNAAEIELAQSVATGQRLDGVLRVAEKATLSLAIDPSVLAAAATSEDPSLTQWADRMLAAAAQTTTYTLPDHDPDLAALAHANVVSSNVLSFLYAPRSFAWHVPDTWRSDLAWPADGVLPDMDTLDLAVSAGRENIVVGHGGLAYKGIGTVTGRADVDTPSGTAHVAVTDPALTEAFLSATDMSGPETVSSIQDSTSVAAIPTQAEGTQLLLADTAAIVSQSPSDPPSLSLVAPRSWTPDVQTAVSILNALDTSGWVTTTTVDTLFSQKAQDLPRTPLPTHHRAKSELDAASVAALEDARETVVTFSSIAAENEDKIWRPGINRLSAPLSMAHRKDPGLREQVVQQVLHTTHEITQESVSVVPRRDINFITDAGNIPVRVRNTLDVDTTVTVVLRPDHPRLTVDSRSTEIIPAGQGMDVLIPVRAIGSGDVEVTAQIFTPAGTKITDDSSFQVRVRAGWEEVGTWVTAGLVALLFLAGIWRTVRRGRSPNRATSQDVEEAIGPSADAQTPGTEA